MPDFKTIAIIVLVVISYWQWGYPESAHDKLEFLWGPVHDKITSFSNPLKLDTNESSECPDNDNPVCGSNGQTYQNICYAALDDIMEVTQGECE